jgi:capsular exopolysaccharide synthesis family protein
MNVIAIRQRTEDAYQPPEDGGELGVISLKWIFAFLVRRWILISAVAFVVAVLCFAFLALHPSRYTATALIMLQGGQDRVLAPDQMVAGDASTTPQAVDSQLEVLRSAMLAGRLVDDLRLVEDPEWNFMLRQPETANQPLTDAERAQVRQSVIDYVEGSISVRRRGLTYAAEVSVTSLDPNRAAQIANRLFALFQLYQIESRLRTAERANEWLSGRVAELRADVQEKEEIAERFRAAHNLISTQGSLLTERQTTDGQVQVLNARADLAEKQARHLQVQAMINGGQSTDAIAAVLQSSVLTQLRAQESEIARRQADFESRYGDSHPLVINVRAERADVRGQINAEIRRGISALGTEVDVARARLDMLETNMSALRGELAGDNEELVQLREYEREAAAARAVYEAFLQRFHEIADQGSLRTAPAELISAATPPQQRSSPQLSLGFVLSLALGLGLGLAVAFLVEALDEGFTDGDEVERKLGAPALALVPKLRRGELRQLPVASQHPAAYLLERQVSAFTEACRVLRTSILFSAAQPKTQVVAITSALANEGKTTMSLCLARVAALSGQRVLLIDCDLRRRTVKDVLDFEPPAGLLQVLAGEVSWRQATYLDDASGMHVLPQSDSGFTPRDIFGGEDMDRLLLELREAFDLIVLDCAPVLAVADTRVVVSKADCAVMVTRWQKTPIRAVRAALAQLQSAGATVRGVALNSVDRRMPGYYSYPVYEFRES